MAAEANPHLARMEGVARLGGPGWEPARADVDAVRRNPPIPCEPCGDGTLAHYSPTVGRHVCACGAIRVTDGWRLTGRGA